MPGRALAALRDATDGVHARLHHHPAFAVLMGGRPEPAAYALLLRRMEGFHRPAEAWLHGAAAATLPELDDLELRRKAHLLADDLHALGTKPGSGWAPPSAPPGRAAVLGALYVVEGATLGGRELGRMSGPMLAGLGLDGHDGRRFFHAYEGGAGQGQMWRGFCAVLERAAAPFGSGEIQAMQMAAVAMFLHMEDWLHRPA